MAEVVRHGRGGGEVVRHGLGMWSVRVEMIGCPACRNVVVAGVRCADRGRKTWRECVKDDMDELGLHSEWVVWICGETSYREIRLTLAERGRNGRFKNKW